MYNIKVINIYSYEVVFIIVRGIYMSQNKIDSKDLKEIKNNIEMKKISRKLKKNREKNEEKKIKNKSDLNKKNKSKNNKKDAMNSNKKKKTNKSSKNMKKNKKNNVKISMILLILTIIIFIIYSAFGRGYIEDMKREDFINMIEPIAVDVYEEYGIYPSVVISRAAVESNWGKSELSKEAFNLFGIKADDSWRGRKIEMITKEGYENVENAQFRKYRSYKESIYDYGKFLNKNKRYKKAGLFKAKNAKEQAQVLENAGYATKENSKGELVYADILIDFMDRYELEKIDKKYVK